jgi:hypothetical protein
MSRGNSYTLIPAGTIELQTLDRASRISPDLTTYSEDFSEGTTTRALSSNAPVYFHNRSLLDTCELNACRWFF